MFYTLKPVSIDIQSYDAVGLIEQFEKFLNENSGNESVDISASDISRNVSVTSLLINDARAAYRDLRSFMEEHNLPDPPIQSLDEIFSENPKIAPKLFWCDINIAVLILDLLKKANQQQNIDEISDQEWTPPENWAYGTDDEKEAYENFWLNKKNI